MADPLVARYQQYFRHPDDTHDILEVGDRAIACANIRRALEMLGFDFDNVPTDDQLYDEALRVGVKRFQVKYRRNRRLPQE